MSVRPVDISGKPTVISTFCGTGGSSLGYHYAGFQELLAIDFDKHAVESFKANFPDVPCWQGNVSEISGEQILNFCGIKKGELDIFDGSPPCQGFSTAGKREVADERNDLFKHYCRLVDELQPKVFVMENVTGMIKGSMKGKFIEIINTLKAMNYIVKAKVLNAKYYGVPQSRERIFFIGVRKDLNLEPVFPIPNPNVISCSEALKDVKPNKILNVPRSAKEYMKLLKPGESISKYHPKGNMFGWARIPYDKPCGTICKQGAHKIFHFKQNRPLAINEASVLCSFPADWKLSGSYSKQWARLGNAVMPLQMKAIAETIAKEILNFPKV